METLHETQLREVPSGDTLTFVFRPPVPARVLSFILLGAQLEDLQVADIREAHRSLFAAPGGAPGIAFGDQGFRFAVDASPHAYLVVLVQNTSTRTASVALRLVGEWAGERPLASYRAKE